MNGWKEGNNKGKREGKRRLVKIGRRERTNGRRENKKAEKEE